MLLIICTFLFFIFLLVEFKSIVNSQKTRTECDYRKRELFTEVDKKVFWILQDIFKNGYFVFPKIAVGAVLENYGKSIEQELKVKRGLKQQAKYQYRGYLTAPNNKLLDFVILNKSTMAVAFIIELEEVSNYYKKGFNERIDSSLTKAGYTYVRVPFGAAQELTRELILQQIKNAISRRAATSALNNK